MIRWNTLSPEQQKASLQRPALGDARALRKTVTDLIERVRKEGDSALLSLTEQFDGAKLTSLRLTDDAVKSAIATLGSGVKEAIDNAYDNIRRFHQAQMPDPVVVETQAGVVCEQHSVALEAVGLYIPGGTAPLPSTVLMLGATAQVAGCPRRVLCTPPNQNGEVAAEILYAAGKCGINEIYLVGGAQAIAAMAYGTESIAKVDKIFGPGNSFVTEAKQQVSLDADGAAIDMPAGPSEVLVLADANANPAFVASDLLSQAEHGKDSQAVLVSASKALIDAVIADVETQLTGLARNEIAAAAMDNSRYILTSDDEESIAVSNAYAPEHLIVQFDNARSWLPKIKHAGSIFLGAYTPESVGDYASGTNHVLPTYGYARNYSSLGLADFMRRYTVQELTAEGLQGLGDTVMTLADAEGLTAHRDAVGIRLASINDKDMS